MEARAVFKKEPHYPKILEYDKVGGQKVEVARPGPQVGVQRNVRRGVKDRNTLYKVL